MLLFPLHTGVRLGEQRAMRWTDVDFELARVYVRRSAPSGFNTIKAPKSNRQRWVDLTPELAAALRTIRHRAELIFCSDAGSMLRPGQFQEVLWAAQRRAGSSTHQVARPPAQLRLDPRLGRDAALSHPRSPRPLVGEDDGALRAPRGVSDRRVHAAALRRRAVEAQPVDTAASWAPGGPEHPRLA